MSTGPKDPSHPDPDPDPDRDPDPTTPTPTPTPTPTATAIPTATATASTSTRTAHTLREQWYRGAMRSFVWVVLAFALSAAGMAWAFRESLAGSPLFVAAILGTEGILAALFVLRASRDGELSAWLRPKWGDFTGGALTATALFGATYVLGRVLVPEGSGRQLWLMRLYLQLGSTDVLRQKAWLAASVIVLFAIVDALAWRGLVPSLLAERVGSRRAWMWAALLYGLSYAPAAYLVGDKVNGPNLLLVSGALVTGIILGASTRFFGRLIPGVIAHSLFAWFSLMTYRLMTPSV